MARSEIVLLLGIAVLVPGLVGAAPLMRVRAGATERVADGRSATSLLVTAFGPGGAPLPDGATVSLDASLGEVQGDGAIRRGRARFDYVAGTWPGTAVLSAGGGFTLVGDTEIELVPGDPVSTVLHLHGSLSEGNGTMRGHAAQAETLGADVLWWTDHDFLYYPDHDQEFTGCDFESGGLAYTMPVWGELGYTEIAWEVNSSDYASVVSSVQPEAAHTGGYGWRLKARTEPGDDWREHATSLSAFPIKLHIKSAMAEVSFRGFFRPQLAASDRAELWITLALSMGEAAGPHRIHFVHTTADYSSLDSDIDVHYTVPGDAGAWSEVAADISQIARDRFPDIGTDASVAFAAVRIRARDGATAWYDVDDLEWAQEWVGDGLRDVQRAYLDDLPTAPTHLVGFEMGTDPERHLNAFGSGVPMVPYSARAGWTTSDAADFVHAYSGIASYNHMFGVSFAEGDDLARAEAVVDAIDTLLAEDAFGCDLLEVGYRQRLGVLADFLEVWDALSVEGLAITGIGASDLHDHLDWAHYVNRFVTWVESASAAEEDLLWNLDRGAAWFGDPTLFEGGEARASLASSTSRATMGQVVEGATDAQELALAASPLRAGWSVRLVEDGAVTETWTVEADGDFSTSTAIDPTGGNVVRFEVVTDTGEPALYTNPIYFWDTVEPGAVGDERRPTP